MTITQYDLKHLKDECTRMTELIDYICESKEYESLFASRNDYEQSLKVKNQIPEEFYNLRCFDVYSCVVFNQKLKKYMITLKGIYSNVLDKYKINQRNNTSFIISDNFDETLEVWKDVVLDVLHNKLKLNGLF